jgi:inosine/xanthosine triphosphatase
MTRVAVGSENAVKVAATERVVGDRFAERGVEGDEGDARDSEPTVVSVGVDSGVSEQPFGESETVEGAENRAARALEADPGADFGVGIEGGVRDASDRPGLYVIVWAAVTGGERLERGGGPALRLPDSIAARIRDGEELGPVLDDVPGTEGSKRRGGAAGVLTDGAIDRESALVHAVACAFGPFRTEFYE